MPSCVSRLILISFISLIAGRPLDSPIQETRTENTQAESSYQAWLPLSSLPLLQLGNPATTSHTAPFTFQIYRFPKHHALSSTKVVEEYRDLLKKLGLEKARHFFAVNQSGIINKQNIANIFDHSATEVVINRPTEVVMPEKPANRQNQELTALALQPKNPPSLVPYRLSPLLSYIKNRNTLQQDKIIRFRTSNVITEEDITTLILKPQSTAVAGVEGKAVSNPLSRAILRKGTNADILFEPLAVAVAGPGGIAHAQSDLEISYEE